MNWTTNLSSENAHEGSANGDVELFAGKEVNATVREVIQNSIDVPDNSKTPVMVEVNMYEESIDKLPQISQVKEIVDNIANTEFWENDQEVSKRVALAKQTLDKDTVKIVRFSDFNTTGAKGAKQGHQARTPFTALTRANYVSDKASSSASGSRGIGKNSVKGISDLRMVLFTSQTKEDGKYSSGQIDLATFAKGDKISNRINYLVGDDNEAIAGEVIDDKFTRNENGTDLRIVGVNEDYGQELCEFGLVYLLENFLTSIYEGRLVVKFLGTTIDKNNLNQTILDLPDDTNDSKKYIQSYYRALKFGEKYQLPADFLTNYGINPADGTFYLETETLFGSKVLFTRESGMKIYDKNFNAAGNFAGVFRATGMLNKVLRNMEDATHTKWQDSLFDNRGNMINYHELNTKFRQDNRYASSLLESLRKFIKEILNQAFNVDGNDEIEADEIANLFYLEETNHEENKQSVVESSNHKISKIKIGKQKQKVSAGSRKIEVTVDDNGEITPTTTRKPKNKPSTSKDKPQKPRTTENNTTYNMKPVDVTNEWALSNDDGSMDYIFEAPKNMSKFGIEFNPVGEGEIKVNPIKKALYNGKEMKVLEDNVFYTLDNIKKGKNISIHLELVDSQPVGLNAILRELRKG